MQCYHRMHIYAIAIPRLADPVLPSAPSIPLTPAESIWYLCCAHKFISALAQSQESYTGRRGLRRRRRRVLTVDTLDIVVLAVSTRWLVFVVSSYCTVLPKSRFQLFRVRIVFAFHLQYSMCNALGLTGSTRNTQ